MDRYFGNFTFRRIPPVDFIARPDRQCRLREISKPKADRYLRWHLPLDLHKGRSGRGKTQSEDGSREFHGVLLWTNEYTASIFVRQDECCACFWFGAASSKNDSKKQSTGLFLQIVVTHFQILFFFPITNPSRSTNVPNLPRKPGPRASRHFWAEKPSLFVQRGRS